MSLVSLYDEASLWMTPSGAKDGKLFSELPVPEYGAELVTNGGFDTDSDWTKTANTTISGGIATFVTGTASLYQSIGVAIGNTYKVTYTIQSGSGSLFLSSGGFGGASLSIPSVIGINSVFVTATTTGPLYFVSLDSVNLSIDNASVKEVLAGDGDFTFSRGSNLAATRVGPTGLIEKGRENLLLQSNQFDTTWVLTDSINLTSGQTGYDGSSDAWKLENTLSAKYLHQSIAVSGVQTISFYAKSGTLDWAFILINSSNVPRVYFDLQNGLVGSELGPVIDSKIESVDATGWYRISITFNETISQIRIYPAAADNDINGTGSIYIQDAQLEIGLAATDYIESGATTGKAGLLENEPRFDYSGGATCPSLLLEPSRTNFIKYSEYLGGNSLSGSISFTYNDSTSPEGLDNAALVSVTSANDRLQPFFSAVNGLLCISIFVKHTGTNFITQLNTFNSGDSSLYGAFANVTSSGVTFSSYQSGYDSADFVDYGNGWFRIYVVCQSTTGLTYAQWRPSANDVAISYPCYGFQAEEGSYPTSYIPNHSGGSVTRGADVCGDAGDASTFNDSEGVLYTEIASLTDDNDGSKSISISSGAYSNNIIIQYTTNTNQIVFKTSPSYTTPIFQSYNVSDITENSKIAFKYKSNDCSFWHNGVKLGSVSSFTPFSSGTLTELNFNRGDGNEKFEGKIKQILYFPTALTDSECIKLTTL